MVRPPTIALVQNPASAPPTFQPQRRRRAARLFNKARRLGRERRRTEQRRRTSSSSSSSTCRRTEQRTSVSRTPTAANNWPRPVQVTQARKTAARGNGHRLHATAPGPTRAYHPGSRTIQPQSFGHRPSRFFSPNAQHSTVRRACAAESVQTIHGHCGGVTTIGCKVAVFRG